MWEMKYTCFPLVIFPFLWQAFLGRQLSLDSKCYCLQQRQHKSHQSRFSLMHVIFRGFTIFCTPSAVWEHPNNLLNTEQHIWHQLCRGLLHVNSLATLRISTGFPWGSFWHSLLGVIEDLLVKEFSQSSSPNLTGKS